MTVHIELVPVISVVAGIAILLAPRLLSYIVAAYLIAAGVLSMLS